MYHPPPILDSAGVPCKEEEGTYRMLRGLHPLLTAELLHALRSAGHGDEIAIVDCNFPAASVAHCTARQQPPILLAGATLEAAVDAVTSVMPLDYFEPWQLQFMAPDDGCGPIPEASTRGIARCREVIMRHNPTIDASRLVLQPVKRSEFYGRAKEAFVVVQAAGERTPYMNVILKKGVIGPDGRDLIPN